MKILSGDEIARMACAVEAAYEILAVHREDVAKSREIASMARSVAEAAEQTAREVEARAAAFEKQADEYAAAFAKAEKAAYEAVWGAE